MNKQLIINFHLTSFNCPSHLILMMNSIITFWELSCSFFNIIINFLFIYLPTIIFAIMSMSPLRFLIFTCCKPTKKFSFNSIKFILIKLIPYLLFLVCHRLTFYIWFNCLFCLLFRVKCNITRGIINPFNFKMRIRFKIITNSFIWHIVNSK